MNKLDKKHIPQMVKEYCDKVHKATLTKERTFLVYSKEFINALEKVRKL